tara:strand:+ start:194 stop:367 length:174 start_codon:yes stop_codon:yes gene_type:complete
LSPRRLAWLTIALALVGLLFLAVSGLWRDTGAITATGGVFLATITILGFFVKVEKPE